VFQVFSRATGHPHLAVKAHSLVASIPSRACCVLPAARPRGSGPTPVGFGAPSTTSLVLAPCEVTCHVHPGSALRLFQPLSGFVASSSFAALFRAATVRGVLPSEVSPRRNRAPLSRPLAPLWSFTDVLRRTHSCLITAGFPDAHTRRRSCLVPPTTMRSLFTHRGALPGPSELERAERPVPPASPTSKPCSPCESVRADPGCPDPAADPLLGLCLPRGPPYHASDPLPAFVPKGEGTARSRRLGHATRRTLQPLATGEASPNRMTRLDLSADSGPLKTGPNRLSTALLLPWPWTFGRTRGPDLRSLEVRGRW